MNVNLSGYITPRTSYGLVTLNLLNGLSKNNEIALFPVNNAIHQIDFGQFHNAVQQSVEHANRFDPNAPSFRVAHQFDMAEGIGKGKRVGYTFFEMDRLTSKEVTHMASLDVRLVPTAWAQSVLANHDLDSQVLHAGYDPQYFYPTDFLSNACNFYCLGKWEVRKQITETVNAFKRAFNKDDNVNLYLAVDNRFMDKNTLDAILDSYIKNTDNIHIINNMSILSLSNFIKQMYCIVAPSLAEGWNLPLLEAMACGKFSIATNYSGHTEFVDSQTSFLLEPTGMVPANDNAWFFSKNSINAGNWCTYDSDQLIEHMRSVYALYNDGVVLNQAACQRATQFTWANSVACLERYLSEN